MDPSAPKWGQTNTGWPGVSTNELSAPLAGNEVSSVAVNDVGLEPIYDPDLESISDNFALDDRINYYLAYVKIETKRSILHLLETAADAAIKNDTNDNSLSSYVGPTTTTTIARATPGLPYDDANCQAGEQIEDQPMSSPPPLEEPIYLGVDDQDLAKVTETAGMRRHTYSSNESDRSGSVRAAGRPFYSDSSLPSLHFPQQNHSSQMPHPLLSKGIAVPTPRNIGPRQSALPTHDSGARDPFPQPDRNERSHHNSTTGAASSRPHQPTHRHVFPRISAAVPAGRLICGIDGCPATIKGKSELKRHQDSIHFGMNFVCLFPRCPERGQIYRKDKIKRHLKNFHGMEDVKAVPKAWWWPLFWFEPRQGWACNLCFEYLGTWERDRRQISGHVRECSNGDEARGLRWPNGSATGYEDEDSICRAFRRSGSLEDAQQAPNHFAVEGEAELEADSEEYCHPAF
ncbi:hypothetical protein BDV96DRAFT_353133 [Lophiotrema nucula]|uniref:C2H2-type domain-containing protein n=1 Tax=Lophiotrema nucula TaxID=690887 RepID=A0A6A5ZMT9_9PLEO|nr:hypothetical protein BDV96DRAFT_353133 [Lophiotrema nucula]